MTRGVAAERDLAARLGLQQQQRHPAEDPALETLLQRMQPDLHRRVLPQQHVMLEVDRYLSVERHVQHRHELALESVGDARGTTLGDLRRKDLRGGRHAVLHSVRFGDAAPTAIVRRRSRARATDRADFAQPSIARSSDNRSRADRLRHRTPQSGHRLDRLRDRLCRAERAARPEQRVRPRAARRPERRRRAGCSTAAAPPSREFLPHVMLRVGDLMQTAFPSIGQDDPVREAGLAMARTNNRPRPGRRRRRSARRRRHDARARAPLHPRVARHLDAAGGDLRPRRRRRARGRTR